MVERTGALAGPRRSEAHAATCPSGDSVMAASAFSWAMASGSSGESSGFRERFQRPISGWLDAQVPDTLLLRHAPGYLHHIEALAHRLEGGEDLARVSPPGSQPAARGCR